jgi:predicted DCC family thiol-disulfide oxidoreductase YuxK
MSDSSGNRPDYPPAPPGSPPRPRLVWDGDCGFCGYWARYWQKLTGDAVEYRPYQDVAAEYPDVPVGEFRRASQYIAPDGRRAAGAEATFATLTHAPGKGFWLWLYVNLPGFAWVSELAYRVISTHRSAAFRVTRLLWGKDLEPPRYDLVSFLFLRLLGLIYLSAFLSFTHQADGLIGSHGILPVAEFVKDVSSRIGATRFFLAPMAFWLDSSDSAIHAVCLAGVAVSILLALGVLTRVSLVLLYLLYLSLFNAGQIFMGYQWDIFLLETGFLALLLTLWRPAGIWLLRWLLFRFMFMSGVVKLASGDPNWWNLSALSYHFLTQPLPTPVAWHAAQLSEGFLKFATGATFAVELGLPFLIFFPRRARCITAVGVLLLESLISLTGNYNWFNLQTMLLCLPLFDDAALRRIVPGALRRLGGRAPREPSRATKIAIAGLAFVIVVASLDLMDERFGGGQLFGASALAEAVEPLHIVNGYGLFAVMTTARHEIVIEGSNDGTSWQEYEFRYKPGDLARPAQWNVPDQPRLDWQMWFAALDDPRRLPWFFHFLEKLLRNEPAVTALLAKNPFPGDPPTYIRAAYYDYTFADPAQTAQGIWWNRRYLGLYFPASHLNRQ